MKYLSLDLETTGLEPGKDQILEVAAVLEDTMVGRSVDDLPYFHCYVIHERLEGNVIALSMNAEILEKLGKREIYYNKLKLPVCGDREYQEGKDCFFKACDVWGQFENWIVGVGLNDGGVTIAGKNAGTFDIPFLIALEGWKEGRIRRRTIDPAVLFLNWDKDEKLPDMSECMKRAGLAVEGGDKLHTALGDARLVIRLIRKSQESIIPA